MSRHRKSEHTYAGVLREKRSAAMRCMRDQSIGREVCVKAQPQRRDKPPLMGAKTPPTEKSFGAYCEEWLTLSRNRVKESTYVKYRTTILRHVAPQLGNYLPREMDTLLVEDFSNRLLEDGLAPKTVRDILCIVKSVLKYCRRQMGAFFPAIEIIFPKETKKTMRVLSPEEQETLVKYLLEDVDRVGFGILLALHTGMRIGELCALKWGDISLAERMVSITSTMQRIQQNEEHTAAKTKVVIGEAKSHTSIRVVPLTNTAAALCEQMRERNRDAYVLTGDTARFMEPRTLQYRFSKCVRACGLEGVHFHTLRHTFATRCVEVGFEIKSLSEILGHASVKITLDRYVHSSIELKRANMSKLAAVGF